MKAGHYENDEASVEIMIRSSRSVVEDLLQFGADFQRDENGELVFTREGAHSEKRIIFHKDVTGKEITSTLLAQTKRRSNIMLLEHTSMIDIIEEIIYAMGLWFRDRMEAWKPLRRITRLWQQEGSADCTDILPISAI